MITLKPQSVAQPQREPRLSSSGWSIQGGILCLLGAVMVSGCVSADQYEAEKSRALNFQRLLAQEEQRTSELNAQLQEAKQEISSLGSQNRNLAVEIDVLREQIGRQQESAPAGDFPASLSDHVDSHKMPPSEPALSEFGLDDFSFDESDFNDFGTGEAEAGGLETSTYYTVVPGDTLYRISREHGVTVNQLKAWNNLTDNIISIGQRLVVTPP